MSREMRKFAVENGGLSVEESMLRAVGRGSFADRESGESPEQYPLL